MASCVVKLACEGCTPLRENVIAQFHWHRARMYRQCGRLRSLLALVHFDRTPKEKTIWMRAYVLHFVHKAENKLPMPASPLDVWFACTMPREALLTECCVLGPWLERVFDTSSSLYCYSQPAELVQDVFSPAIDNPIVESTWQLWLMMCPPSCL
jgi:hypothetical protein